MLVFRGGSFMMKLTFDREGFKIVLKKLLSHLFSFMFIFAIVCFLLYSKILNNIKLEAVQDALFSFCCIIIPISFFVIIGLVSMIGLLLIFTFFKTIFEKIKHRRYFLYEKTF